MQGAGAAKWHQEKRFGSWPRSIETSQIAPAMCEFATRKKPDRS
jgi:hypothetical protein